MVDKHTYWLEKLQDEFLNQGFNVLREGKIKNKGWQEPDLFIFNKHFCLIAVVEILIAEGYGMAEMKAEIIKKFINPKYTIIFRDVKYADITRKNKPDYNKKYGVPKEFANSHRTLDKWFKENYFKNKGLYLEFWNETNYTQLISNLKKEL